MDTPLAPDAPILAPFDGSRPAEAVFPYLAALAPYGATILLLQVLPEPQPIRDVLGQEIVSAAELLRLGRQGAAAELAAAAERLRALAPHLSVETIVEVGDPAEAIERVAEERGAGLIALSSRGRGSLAGQPAFGSVAHRVARTASVPVMIVHPAEEASHPAAPIQRLLVPVDGSDLGDRVVPVAQALAARLDLPAHLLCVVDLAETLLPPLDYGAAIGRQHYEELLADAHRAASRLVEGHGARLLRSGVAATWEVREGPAAPRIVDACCPGDLLVISSHGRSSIRRWHLGSVAEKLVREAGYPVLVLRPPRSMVAAAEAGVPAARATPEAG